MPKEPLILTLGLDGESQAFFDAGRKRYFPPDRNYLFAHLTLFHQLPAEPATFDYFCRLAHTTFELRVTGLLHLGAGVAYRLESPILQQLHLTIKTHFLAALTAQDRGPFRPHITIQNKVTAAQANELFQFLQSTFTPFVVQATGLELSSYLGGPWRHERTIAFGKLEG